jgi:hypothetical protein
MAVNRVAIIRELPVLAIMNCKIVCHAGTVLQPNRANNQRHKFNYHISYEEHVYSM